MSIFSGLRSYPGKWAVKAVDAMSDEDKNLVASATVVNSQFGLSCCFMMKSGNIHFIPMDPNAVTAPGDVLNLNEVKIVTLGKEGEADIQRIRPN